MTAYVKSVSGSVSFAGGANLYPDSALFPSDAQFPFGGAIIATINHGVTGVLQPVGAFAANANSRTRSFTAALQPQVVFFKGSARLLFAGVLPTAGLVAVRTSHSVAKALFGALQAAGSLHAINTNLINPPGGGGYALPMGDGFFLRYKPTLRKQKMRV